MVKRTKQRSTNNTQKTQDWATWTPNKKNRGELRCYGWVSSSCSTNGTPQSIISPVHVHYQNMWLSWLCGKRGHVLYQLYLCWFSIDNWRITIPLSLCYKKKIKFKDNDILISNISNMNVLFSIWLIMNTIYYQGNWHDCVVFFQGVHVSRIFTFSLYLHESICAADWFVCCCT